ncbi:MAG: hypothetical protein IT165_26090 [Bryobacterales bacterium]|nr:hypothetical protein [Bryobacterales bacterium]
MARPREVGHWQRLGVCLDWYDRDYYASAPAANPQGPQKGTDCVLRGGSWAGPSR